MNSEALGQMVAEVEKAGNYSLANLKYSDYVARVNQDLAPKLPEKTALYFEKASNAVSEDGGRGRPHPLKIDTGALSVGRS